jgi:uncharacterized protein (DUF362 family)
MCPQINKKNEFELTETMWGYISMGAATYEDGYKIGKQKGNKLQYGVTLEVKNFKEFTASDDKKAPMKGWVTCENLFGEKLRISDGEYGLYWPDPQTGERRISYKFNFKDKAGKEYQFFGIKKIVSGGGIFDVLEDHTTLFADISKFDNGEKTIVAKGIIHYHVEDFPAMVFSIRTPKNDTLINRIRMTTKFFSFVSKEISEYFQAVNPFYQADYHNLACKGFSTSNNKDIEFFFFSGAHDKGFPWGDNVGFSDIGLVLKDGETWRRFALTKHAIPQLNLKITEGSYSLQGKLFEITKGYQTSFKEINQEKLPNHLRAVDATINLHFKPKLIETRNIPFETNFDNLKSAYKKKHWKKIKKSKFYKELKKIQRDIVSPGYTTEIYRLAEIEGNFKIDGVSYTIQKDESLGEGEFGKLAGLRKPKLYYNYFCAVDPDNDFLRIHIRSGILRSLSKDFLSNKAEEIMGDVVGQFSKMDLQITGEQAEDMEIEDKSALIKPREDLLEIINDHYPTATFQRRIVVLPDGANKKILALEEDMSIIDLEPDGSKETATVAAIKNPDRFKALDKVLELTGFFNLLNEAQKQSGKTKDKFSIIIKPNFSFMYSLSDITTFTDPDLVEHLIDRIYDKGYKNISVAEAHSTYTIFFTNRDIPTLARYIGLRGKNYKIIDLSENFVKHDFKRTLGKHEVHPEWKDADFRISFAKNKSHSYAFYTLTIKNIYGALPRKNKFKEYHCNEKLGIYVPTIDFIEEFPIHFGLVDGYYSADGAFGIFADTEPNFTQTIIGGNNIVAVDWVGASKMGLDPMISDYMKLAVERFGKPKIKLIGDHSVYPEWQNVPEIISEAAFAVMDRNYTFGNFLYSVMAQMDPFFTFKPDEVSRRVARFLTEPIRKIFFEWTKGDRQELTWDHLQKMFDREQLEYVKKLINAISEGFL